MSTLKNVVEKHVHQLLKDLNGLLASQAKQPNGKAPNGNHTNGKYTNGKPVKSAKASHTPYRLPCRASGCKELSKGPRFRYLCDKHRTASVTQIREWTKKFKTKPVAVKRASR